jgi:hypothetical protein
LISHPEAEPIIALFAEGSEQICACKTIVHSIASHFHTYPISSQLPSTISWLAHEAPLASAAQITIFCVTITAAGTCGREADVCSRTLQRVFANLAIGFTIAIAGQTRFVAFFANPP